MKEATKLKIESLVGRHPEISRCCASVEEAFHMLLDSQRSGGKVLVCGNGGSAADAQHIVCELLKSFLYKRPLSDGLRSKLESVDPERGAYLAEKLQTPIRALSLCSEISLMTAVSNDTAADMVFAQQVLGQGTEKDVLLAITTSGNSTNIVNAVLTAKALGLKTIGLTGSDGGKVKDMVDCCILAPGYDTPEIQESHLPIYHCLCAMLEAELFTN